MNKIALFCAQYPPHVGGLERFVQSLAIQLNKNGNKVYVVTSNLYKSNSIEDQNGITVVNVPCFPLMDGRLPITKPNKEHKRLKKYLAKQELDLIVINVRFYTHSCFGAKFAKDNNIKCITIEHGSSYIGFNNKLIDPFVHAYEHLITKYLKKYCKDYYGVSKDACEWSSKFGIKSKGIIHGSIDVDSIQNNINNNSSNEKLHNLRHPLIANVGRLIEGKGVLEVDEAVSTLANKYPNIQLAIAGNGQLMKNLKNNKHDTTLLLGQINNDEAHRLISKADIFVLPSETEGFSVVALEAFACKTYVISTNVGGAKEIITDSSYGTIIPDNKPDTIAKAIDFALSNPKHMKKAIEKSYSKVTKNFTWDDTAKKIENLI